MFNIHIRSSKQIPQAFSRRCAVGLSAWVGLVMKTNASCPWEVVHNTRVATLAAKHCCQLRLLALVQF